MYLIMCIYLCWTGTVLIYGGFSLKEIISVLNMPYTQVKQAPK